MIPGTANLLPGTAEPTEIALLQVPHDMFQLLGVPPIAGRSFTAEEDAARGPVVALIWTPLQPDPQALPRSTHPVLMLSRLAPDATIDAAQKELERIAADLERTYSVNVARRAR